MSHAPSLITLLGQDLLIVVSHDCDLCNPDVEKEPWAELMLVQVLDQLAPQGHLTLMKNPRLLQFKARLGQQEMVCQAVPHERWRVPRVRLTSDSPEGRLETDPPDLLAQWLSRRYVRAAFPNEFDRRCRPVAQVIERELQAHGQFISGLFLIVEDEEHSVNQPYLIVVRACMPVAHYGDQAGREQAQQAVDRIAAHLQECDGVEVQDSALVSEAEISLDDLRLLKRWDYYEPISRAEPEGLLAPQVPSA
jgi:hypothetical protein